MPRSVSAKRSAAPSCSAGSVTPVNPESFESWAKATRRTPSRKPVTTRKELVDAGIPEVIRRACELKAEGQAAFSIPQLLQQLKSHGYPLKESALRTYIRKHLKFDWKRGAWREAT